MRLMNSWPQGSGEDEMRGILSIGGLLLIACGTWQVGIVAFCLTLGTVFLLLGIGGALFVVGR